MFSGNRGLKAVGVIGHVATWVTAHIPAVIQQLSWPLIGQCRASEPSDWLRLTQLWRREGVFNSLHGVNQFPVL